jgi:hypothetical protein
MFRGTSRPWSLPLVNTTPAGMSSLLFPKLQD